MQLPINHFKRALRERRVIVTSEGIVTDQEIVECGGGNQRRHKRVLLRWRASRRRVLCRRS